MPNERRIINRLRTENAVLRSLVVELGGGPPPVPISPVVNVEVRGPAPTLPMLAHLAQRGL